MSKRLQAFKQNGQPVAAVLQRARQVLHPLAAKSGSKDESQASGRAARSPSPDAPLLEVGEPNKPAKPLQRKAFRRKGLDEEELRESKAAARKQQEQQDAAVQRIAQQLKSTQAAGTAVYKPSVMLIDGYNIIFGLEPLQQLFTRNPEFGRGELEKWIEAYAKAACIQCLVVYDAMGGVSTKTTYEQVGPWLTRAFAAQSEADTLIVDLAKRYQSRGHYKVVCVSGDQRIAMELADEEHSIIILDASVFMQHLQECQAGNVSGPAAWRSLWALPRLSKHRPQEPMLWRVKSSSPDSSDEQDEVQGQQGAMLENLSSELEDIVLRSQLGHEQTVRRLKNASGSAYLLSLGETGLDPRKPSGHDPAAAHAADWDSDEDDLDLDALLKGK